MPALNQYIESSLQRVLCYGSPKTRKTWWLGRQAELGYNVLLLDGDRGSEILRNLSPAAQSRIYVIDIADEPKRAVMAPFITRLLKFRTLLWDEAAKTFAYQPTDTTITINVDNFGRDMIFGFDSYSAFVRSLALQFSIENGIDLSDAKKTEWDGYRWCGALATWTMQELQTLPCHQVMIAHQEVYEKRTTDKRTKQTTVDWTRIQVKSTSGPHSMSMAQYFTDLLYFYIQGSVTQIDTRAEKDRDGGCRNFEPKLWQWDTLQMPALATAAQPLDFSANKGGTTTPKIGNVIKV